jgi:hypothetical protein
MRELVDRALNKSGDPERYSRRVTSNPLLTELGCLPHSLDAITNCEPPWFCHSLAFRMATYSNASDNFFERLETLLKLARQAKGWAAEYSHWNASNDHWAKKYNKFNEFLWLLQCYEFFSSRGLPVSFPAPKQSAMPDLFIEREGQKAVYAECSFYSKWWHREQYLKELLSKIDSNLLIKRIYNVLHESSTNPFYSDSNFVIALGDLATALTEAELAALRVAAQEVAE